MALRIMENKRIPRKIKKALKYAFLHPRVCGRLIRYGAVYTIGRNSKWKCKILQNWKYLLSSTLPDGMYYELTYNGDKKQWYLDAYKKFDNVCYNLG